MSGSLASAEKNDALHQHQENFAPTTNLTTAKVPINRKLAYINLWAAVASYSFGFGASIIASSLGQPNWYIYFDLATNPNLTNIIGAIASMLNIGAVFGLIAVSLIMDKYGRRAAFMFCSFFYLLGTALCGGSVNYKMFIMSRFVLGIGAWGYVLCCIVYTQELAPTTRRGQLGGAVGVALSLGFTSAAWVGVGFYFVKNENNWRIPILITLLGPLVVIAGYFRVPESPRWLVSVGREVEALAVLKDLHGSPLDPNELVANEEYYQIVEQTRLDKTLPSSWGSMFTTYGRRVLIACMVIFFYGCTGIQIITNYGPVLYASLGFSAVDALIIAGATGTWSFLLNCVCAGYVDKIGRKPMLVGSIGGSGIILIIFVALLAVNPTGANVSMARATVGMIFVFFLPYSFCEPTVFLYIGEIFGSHVRTKGTALVLILGQFNSIWITFGQPSGTAHIHYKFYLIFVVLSLVGSTTLFFFLPETKNVPLEQVAALFGENEVAVFAEDIRVDANHKVVAANRTV